MSKEMNENIENLREESEVTQEEGLTVVEDCKKVKIKSALKKGLKIGGLVGLAGLGFLLGVKVGKSKVDDDDYDEDDDYEDADYEVIDDEQ
mgnify:CR=1 FL=1